ncbi:MAG TPA: hypothetical protein VFW27_20335, partial [Actinoplanes sp.]|nr:hypothetical protein [Actinoplanes sp.]
TAAHPDDTDWQQIALLYGELLRQEPSPVVEANRAIAVAMSDGAAAGMVILDALRAGSQLDDWPQLHIARTDLLRRLARPADAVQAYRTALALPMSTAEQAFITSRINQPSTAPS